LLLGSRVDVFASESNLTNNFFNGAEAPKVLMPIIVPRNPVYRSQPRVEACSTATRRVTSGGNTDAR
jgi:hypothetical protein